MAITPLTLLKSCFGVRPQPQTPPGAVRATRRVSIAVPVSPRAPVQAPTQSRFAKFKSWVSRTFLAVICCGFRRQPAEDLSSTQDQTPRTHGAESSYLGSVEPDSSTSERLSAPPTPHASLRTMTNDSASISERNRSTPVLVGADDTDDDASDAFSVTDSGYEADSAEVEDFVSDREVDEPQGQRVNLARQDLRGRDLSALDLRGANLEGANLDGMDLRGLDLTGANLKRASLKGARLEGAILRKTDFGRADLRGAKLRDARIAYASFQDCDLRDTELSAAQYVWEADFRGANLLGAQLDRLGLLQNRCELAKAHLDHAGVQALRDEIEALGAVGLADARRLQRLLDDGVNGASILTSIDTAPVSGEVKVSLMESLLAKVGAAYRAGGSSDAARFVASFLNKHPFYAQHSLIIASFPKEPPAELDRRSDSPLPSLHPRVRALSMSGGASRSESSDSEKSSSSAATSRSRSRAGSLRDSVRSILPGSSSPPSARRAVVVPQPLPPVLDVGDPQTVKLLRAALERGEDLRLIELDGQIGDHFAARQLLDLLVDIPPEKRPRITAGIADNDFDLRDDYRQGKSDEMWERTLTWAHLAEMGIGVRSPE